MKDITSESQSYQPDFEKASSSQPKLSQAHTKSPMSFKKASSEDQKYDEDVFEEVASSDVL